MTPSNQAENMMSVATVAKNITHDASQIVRIHSPTEAGFAVKNLNAVDFNRVVDDGVLR